ncbi:hypothetical protein [uncultured Odoribacter sp.]|uniref:hypothetical protein n=1 Tax=uncultured Odoribacter sp. TaxID=876416 RepID=UPI00260DE77A|nr:hypothetical protein [uncultured Odoribacter sp.]
MKTNWKTKFGYIVLILLLISIASCRNSAKRNAAQMNQPQDSAVIIEQETVIIAVDSISPDSVPQK